MTKRGALSKGIAWSVVDKSFIVVFQLLFEIVLARLLLPSDYGIVAMVTVFIAIAQVFVDGGFMNALIQKQDRTEEDYATAFYFNVLVALGLYVLLIALAPTIANFYEVQQLNSVIKIIGLNLILNAVTIVYRTKLSVELNFKRQALVSIIGILFSGFTGILMAYKGFGVWALISQSVLFYAISAILLVSMDGWFPKPKFSVESFKSLFGFGSKLLIAGIIQNIYSNVYSLFIGKVFAADKLGLYVKANQFTHYPSGVMTNTFQRVMYPFLSKYQNDNAKLIELNRQYYLLLAMIYFPLFVGLSVLAEPFVVFLLSENWIDAVPLIRVLAIAFLLHPFININMYLFQIKGMSSVFLRVEVITKISGFIILFISLRYNVLVMCYGILLNQVFHWLLSAVISDRIIGAKVLSQVRDLLALIFVSVLIAWAVHRISIQFTQFYLQLAVGIVALLVFYAIYYAVAMRQNVKILLQNVKNRG